MLHSAATPPRSGQGLQSMAFGATLRRFAKEMRAVPGAQKIPGKVGTYHFQTRKGGRPGRGMHRGSPCCAPTDCVRLLQVSEWWVSLTTVRLALLGLNALTQALASSAPLGCNTKSP